MNIFYDCSYMVIAKNVMQIYVRKSHTPILLSQTGLTAMPSTFEPFVCRTTSLWQRCS